MLPTEEQIRQAAFDRWQRRGRVDGLDRDDWLRAQDELTFRLNYLTIVEYHLGDSERPPPDRSAIADPTGSGEWAAGARYALAGSASGRKRGLVSTRRGRCSRVGARPRLSQKRSAPECASSIRDALEDNYVRFWDCLTDDREGRPGAVEHYSFGALKGLVACALAIMPEAELRHFVDTLEWVSNPDPDRDGPLFREQATCLVYTADFLRERSWASLARRVDQQALFPYMIFFLAHGGIVLQVQLPLCIRDHDLDGRPVRIPCRSFSAGEGAQFEQAKQLEFPILSKIPILLSKTERSS